MKTAKFIQSLLAPFVLTIIASGCGPGPRGAMGPQGEPGVSAQRAESGITATMNCDGAISGLNGPAQVLNGLFITYDAVLTAAGDVYSTATISDLDFQVSGTAFWAANQQGAQSGSVFITNDMHETSNGGFWEIKLDRETLITTAIYEDSSLGHQSPVTINFRPNACSTQRW